MNLSTSSSVVTLKMEKFQRVCRVLERSLAIFTVTGKHVDVTVVLAGLEEERQRDTVDSVLFSCPDRQHYESTAVSKSWNKPIKSKWKACSPPGRC